MSRSHGCRCRVRRCSRNLQQPIYGTREEGNALRSLPLQSLTLERSARNRRLPDCNAVRGDGDITVRTAFAFLLTLIFVGCAHQEQARNNQPTSRSARAAPPNTVGPYATPLPPISHPCRPEPPDGCNGIREVATCDLHKRCQWVREHERSNGRVVAGYCRRLPCND